jgi:hypothetical protein
LGAGAALGAGVTFLGAGAALGAGSAAMPGLLSGVSCCEDPLGAGACRLCSSARFRAMWPRNLAWMRVAPASSVMFGRAGAASVTWVGLGPPNSPFFFRCAAGPVRPLETNLLRLARAARRLDPCGPAGDTESATLRLLSTAGLPAAFTGLLRGRPARTLPPAWLAAEDIARPGAREADIILLRTAWVPLDPLALCAARLGPQALMEDVRPFRHTNGMALSSINGLAVQMPMYSPSTHALTLSAWYSSPYRRPGAVKPPRLQRSSSTGVPVAASA